MRVRDEGQRVSEEGGKVSEDERELREPNNVPYFLPL